MDTKKIKIYLGKKGPKGLLPDDIIQGVKTGIKYNIISVNYDKSTEMYFIWSNIDDSVKIVNPDTEFILVKGSKFAPWYHEVCQTCVTQESCDICQKMTSWTTKKFAYIGDTIEFFGSQEVVEEIAESCSLLTVTTDRTACLYLDDPELKIIKRGPWVCYRSKLNPDYLGHCSVCLRPKCSECFFKKILQEKQS